MRTTRERNTLRVFFATADRKKEGEARGGGTRGDENGAKRDN